MGESSSSGFSLVEAIVATALSLTVAAVAFALVEPARASLGAQPGSADMQQRLRVAAGALYKDLVMAGAGVSRGANAGPLVYYFAPVLPYRQGTSHDDPAGTFRTDTITVMYVPPTMAQTTLASAGPGAVSADISLNHWPGCPLLDALCGFKSGMTVLLYDGSGEHDTFAMTSVQPSGPHVQRAGGALTYSAYPADTTTIAEITNIVYSLKTDGATGASQLVAHEGATGSDVPVVDHLVGLTFDYYGDPRPPELTGQPLGDPPGPWTTYGPPPPTLLQQIPTGGYPAGENCTFVVDPVSGLQVPRLPILDAGGGVSGLVLLTPAQLVDGPWCPDAANANRWDADLLRIRTIGVTLRVEAADVAMRGPASILFTNGGTARNGARWLPDQTIRFQVTPRSLELGK